MTENALWAWLALLLLGAYHGINPGMGWLFAVALGMQEKSSSAVWRALPPIAAGHALAIGAVVIVAAMAGMALPLGVLKLVVAVILVALGLYRLFRHRHPRGGRHASRLQRSDNLVFPDGVGTRRRAYGATDPAEDFTRPARGRNSPGGIPYPPRRH